MIQLTFVAHPSCTAWNTRGITKSQQSPDLLADLSKLFCILFTNCHALQCVIQSHISSCSYVFCCLLTPSSGSFSFLNCLLYVLLIHNSQHSTKEEYLRKNTVHFVGWMMYIGYLNQCYYFYDYIRDNDNSLGTNIICKWN